MIDWLPCIVGTFGKNQFQNSKNQLTGQYSSIWSNTMVLCPRPIACQESLQPRDHFHYQTSLQQVLEEKLVNVSKWIKDRFLQYFGKNWLENNPLNGSMGRHGSWKIMHWAHVGAWSPYLRLIWENWFVGSTRSLKKSWETRDFYFQTPPCLPIEPIAGIYSNLPE